jgi:hypothetical protein
MKVRTTLHEISTFTINYLLACCAEIIPEDGDRMFLRNIGIYLKGGCMIL